MHHMVNIEKSMWMCCPSKTLLYLSLQGQHEIQNNFRVLISKELHYANQFDVVILLLKWSIIPIIMGC